MASQQRKKTFTIKFELGIGGLLGVGIVTFCIFLWLFLLGIWAGQTVLQPISNSGMSRNFTAKVSEIWGNGQEEVLTDNSKKAVDLPIEDNASAKQEDYSPEHEQTFFSLQIAAFRDQDRAKDSVLSWRSRGHQAFLQPPDDGGGDGFWRVFIGKFEKLADANASAVKLEEEEDIRAYIALLPASKIKTP
ncbi:MAG: SPOR domain-containing protein [Proteobacteria bacterium]|nr:SPOR domain-containing protein [Pseudomonadota bacterium]MBU1710799.1 SPOR domain-containing protein [Pseudomonadota bacterium]